MLIIIVLQQHIYISTLSYLNTTEALGSQDIDTFVRDCVMAPLKQVDDGLLLVLAVGLGVVNSGRR